MLPEIEHDRAKMDAMIRQNDGFYKKISFFDQYSSLRSERVEFYRAYVPIDVRDCEKRQREIRRLER